MRKIIAIAGIACMLPLTAICQQWVDVFLNSQAGFEQKQQAWNAWAQGKDLNAIRGWKQFKRWEYYYQRRMGTAADYQQADKAVLDYFLQHHNGVPNITNTPASSNGSWTFIGPSVTPSNGGGAGRVNCVEFIPGTADVMIGAPNGGLWRRSGTAWSTNTDNLSYIGFSDILINPGNAAEMYAATGDADAGDAPCIGVLKSNNGGTTWTSAGLSTGVSRIYKLMAAPNNFNQLVAATNAGVYTSSNGGASWTLSLSGVGTVYDIEFKPLEATIIYAVTANGFYKSTNGGATFSSSGAGLVTTGMNRRAIAVTPADPERIYLIGGRGDNSGFHSFWRSNNSGDNFTKTLDGVTGTLNLLGWNANGADVSSGGQSWYDLCIAAHPGNADIVFTGGVNIWRTADGGGSFTLNGHWFGGGGVPYVHADIHNLDFTAGGELLASTDGGLFFLNNPIGVPNWTDWSNGLQIGQMYRIGASQTDDGIVITGWQDNGTNLRQGNTSTWRRVIGGDGMESAVDPGTSNIMLGELYYGAISKSVNGGTSFSQIVGSSGAAGTVNESGPWVTNYVIAKSNPQVYYVGKSNVYRSASGGSSGSFTASTGIPSGGQISALAVAPTNENVVYASKGSQLYVSTDGSSFALRTTGLPGITISYITVGANPNHAWVVLAGSSAGNKVFKTTNAGVNWTNVSGDFPNIPAVCIVVDEQKPHNQLYVGTITGVYYKNDTLPGWITFDNGLPNTEVTELEIVYSSQKIKAATYGRGAWESDLFTSAQPCGNIAPVADFISNKTDVCAGETVNFTNTTAACAGNTYSWTFAGGTPGSSTATNPVVVYSTPGQYSASLTASNAGGSNTKTANNYMLVRPVVSASVNIGPATPVICSGDSVLFTANIQNGGTAPVIVWQKNGVFAGTGSSSIWMRNLVNGDVIRCLVTSNERCLAVATATSNEVTVTVNTRPAKPVLSFTGGNLVSSAAAGNVWFNTGTVIGGANGATYHPVSNGLYTVQVTQNGCISPMSDPIRLNIEGLSQLFPVPSSGQVTFDFYIPPGATNYGLALYAANGQLIHKETANAQPGVNRVVYNWNKLAAGTYYIWVTAGTYTYRKKMLIAR